MQSRTSAFTCWLIIIVVPTFRGKSLQMLRTAGLTVILIGAVAALAPLRTIANQLQAYIAIFGTNNPTDAKSRQQAARFFPAGRPLDCFLASLLFVCSLVTLHDKRASGKLRNRLVISGALIASIVTLVQFRTGNFVWNWPDRRRIRICLSFPCHVAPETQIFACLPARSCNAVPLAATFGTSNRIVSQLPFFAGLWGFVGLVALSGGSGQREFRRYPCCFAMPDGDVSRCSRWPRPLTDWPPPSICR